MAGSDPELQRLGWDDFFQAQLDRNEEHLVVGRVIRQDLAGYRVAGACGLYLAILSGQLRYRTESRAELPAVGDWILCETTESGDGVREAGPAVIRRILRRRTLLSRLDPHRQIEEQAVAANLDKVFIVCGLDHNFSLRRIERFLLLSRASNATPVVLLSKADLCTSAEVRDRKQEVQAVAPGVDVLLISAFRVQGLDILVQRYLTPGRTAVLVGSSGVGKSTLVNALLGEERMATGEVSQGAAWGRHITTYRELLLLPGGGLVIDTPGMRDLQTFGDEDSLMEPFSDIEKWTASCRFRDCTHRQEPDCAVIHAKKNGLLTRERLESYLKLQGEVRATQLRKEEKHWRADRQKHKKVDRRWQEPSDSEDI